jgi:nucleoid DNA-binding protein
MAISTIEDLVTAVHAKQETNKSLTKADIKQILKTAFDDIKLTADAGETVRIHNFGTFVNKTRAAREGRNPATGEAIQIAESTSLHFKATKHGK